MEYRKFRNTFGHVTCFAIRTICIIKGLGGLFICSTKYLNKEIKFFFL